MYKYANKIDALTAILKRLDSGEQLTTERLSQDFQVGVRTIYRYLSHLQAAGYPIYYDKQHKSYRFLHNFRLNQLKAASGDAAFSLHPINQMNGMAIATFRLSGECIHKNRAMVRLLCCPDRHACCANFRELDWWRESGLLAMAEEAIATGHEVCRDLTITLNNRERWIQAHMTLVEQGAGSYLLLLAQDLSPRMHKELQVARFFAAMNQPPRLILVTDAAGVIEYVSERAEELTGYSAAELIGANPRILQSGMTPPGTYHNLWSTISQGFSWSGELYNRKKNGDGYWQHLHIVPIRNHQQGVSRYVAVIEDISRQKLLDEEIYRYAIIDRITGLYNRRIWLALGNRDLAAAQRYRHPMTLLLVDIDRFKAVNDQYGYPAGNRYLQQLADCCRVQLRSTDLIGRFDKDAFTILLTESTLADGALVAARIHEQAGQIRIDTPDGALACTVTVAGASLAPEQQSLEQLVTACEGLLRQQQAQQQGNRCIGFS